MAEQTVVHEAGQGERFAERAAADRALRLAQRDAPAGLRERDRRRQPIRPGADDGRGIAHGEESRARFAGACFSRQRIRPLRRPRA